MREGALTRPAAVERVEVFEPKRPEGRHLVTTKRRFSGRAPEGTEQTIAATLHLGSVSLFGSTV
jgi:hypothetical protein